MSFLHSKRILSGVMVFSAVMLLLSSALKAQTVVFEPDSIECQIYFHLSKTEVDPEYMGNAARIRKFVDEFRTIQQDPSYRISAIDVLGAASPEGYHGENIELSQNRAASFINYLERFLTLSNYVIKVTSLGSDWDGLRRMVVESQVPYKEEVLAIIDSEPTMVKWNGRDSDSRLRELHTLRDGMPYEYIETFLLPYLRESYIKVSCKYERVAGPGNGPEGPGNGLAEGPGNGPAEGPDKLAEGPDEGPEEVEYVEEALPLYRFMMRNDDDNYGYYKLVFAFRENLLLPLLNIGFEVPIGNRWSVAVDHYYPWLWRYWPSHSNKYCYELQWEELNIKYWLGDEHQPGRDYYPYRLLGHAVGVFGIGGYYDLEHNWSGHQGELWGGGVDYQYARPLGRRMHVEFSLGVGYMYSKARTYDVFQPGGKLIRRRGDRKQVSYFGPLKADISLIFPLYKRYGDKYITKEVKR